MESPARPPLSDAELAVLRVLWEEGEGTVRVVSERLLKRGGKPWAYTTVQTLLQRLKGKGYVDCESGDGLAHVFRATTDREDLIRDRLRDLADELCEGEPAPLLLTLVENNRFSADELARLRAILDKAVPPTSPKRAPRSSRNE